MQLVSYLFYAKEETEIPDESSPALLWNAPRDAEDQRITIPEGTIFYYSVFRKKLIEFIEQNNGDRENVYMIQ